MTEHTGRRGLDLSALSRQFKERILREMDLAALVQLSDNDKRRRIAGALEQMIWHDRLILSETEKASVIQQVLDESVGLGPLEPLLHDPTITEVMVVKPDEVYFERDGQLRAAPEVRFTSPEHLLHIIERIVAPLGRRIDEASPMVDARLPDGSRVNAVIPPVALHGPAVTIRRFRPSPWTLVDLVAKEAMSPEMGAFLARAVAAKLNLIISGGTGSGKTSLLGALVGLIPEGERLVTIEDMAELNLNRRHVVAMEGRPPNLEGRGEITIRTLIRNALRMRPDRIIVGEVRSEEGFDLLQAMNTGHPGSISTLHANSPADALARLEQMVVIAGTRMPLEAIREHIASTIHLVVQTQRLPDGSRKVAAIAEVARGEINTLFRFRTEAVTRERVHGSFEQVAAPQVVVDMLSPFGEVRL